MAQRTGLVTDVLAHHGAVSSNARIVAEVIAALAMRNSHHFAAQWS